MIRTVTEGLKLEKMRMMQHRKAQGETGFSATVWFWVLLALFLATVVVVGYLLAKKFLPSPTATQEKLTDALHNARE
ncbi:MAG: hypothetical protein Q7R76_02040 [Candidatus Woesearchaeota archaeon]|nr:hypothetical protein [Candidatus Woesearchaeota archaeon]